MDLKHPLIIQGGMGIGASNWRLARTVSLAGHLGVVSGVGLDTILARRLQDGDPDGHMRRALAQFPVPEIAERILQSWFIPGGKAPDAPYRFVPMHTAEENIPLWELTIAGNFVEVFLAKEGHTGCVGMNYLEKIQLPNIPAVYGAMLAGVDYIIMGAGIPRENPGYIDRLAGHRDFTVTVQVEGASSQDVYSLQFDPKRVISRDLPPLKRPRFLAIISSAVLAITLAKKATGRVDGFVIEGPSAGGHNAPPRGELQLNGRGEPVYGPRDEVELEKIRKLELPFWLAGSYGEPGMLREALALGAAGIQVGTPFAFCRESGIREDIKETVIRAALEGRGEVFSDPLASPSGFPFKVVELRGSVSERHDYESRTRICDLGYLRRTYKRPDGTLGYRCASEDVQAFVRKGGNIADTLSRKCICNGLVAAIGLPQVRPGGIREKAIVTAGDGLKYIARFVAKGESSYSAEDVMRVILAEGPFPEE
jgi:nitronate monooxygenase